VAKRRIISDPDAQRIAQSYRAAKAANPQLTQGEFARKSFPTISERYHDAKSRNEQKKIEQSGARYLRLVLEGKRTGRINVQRGTATLGGGLPDAYQVFVPVAGGGWKSFDLEAAGGRSTFDIPLLEARLRETPDVLETKRNEWARRYAIQGSELRVENFEVRRVQRHRKRAVHIDLRELSPFAKYR